MPNTSNLGLPYPALTDAPNVPQHMQNLAGAVDTRLGGGWSSFQFTTDGSVGTFQTSLTQANAYKMIGNKTMAIRVHLTLTAASGVNGTAPLELGPIPAGHAASGVNTLTGMVWRSNTLNYPLTVQPSATRFNRLFTNSNVISSTVPWTWAAGDVIRFAGTFELQ